MSAAATVKVPGVAKVGRWFEADYSVVFSGTYSTGGDTLDLRVQGMPGNTTPSSVTIRGSAGFVYGYVPGSNLGNGKVQIWCNTAGGANTALGEHTAASVVAGVTGDTIVATVKVPAYRG